MTSFKVENLHKHVNALYIINIFKSTPLIKLTFLFYHVLSIHHHKLKSFFIHH